MPTPDLATEVADLREAIESLVERHESQQWPRWLSIDAAARYASLGEKSVRKLVSSGQLAASRTIRGKLLIDRMQLDGVLLAGIGRSLRRGRGIRQTEK